MKNKTKANLLKTRGIIKKVCSWTPLILVGAGLGLGAGFLIGGSVKAGNAVDEFKQTPMYAEVYNQEYEEVKNEYDSGNLTIFELNEKLETLNDENYPRKVLEEAGDEAKEYKERLKAGIAYEYASTAGWMLAFGGTVLLFPWLMGPEISDKCDYSAGRDFYNARRLLESDEIEKKKKELEELTGQQDDDEEELPNIEDSYYKE